MTDSRPRSGPRIPAVPRPPLVPLAAALVLVLALAIVVTGGDEDVAAPTPDTAPAPATEAGAKDTAVPKDTAIPKDTPVPAAPALPATDGGDGAAVPPSPAGELRIVVAATPTPEGGRRDDHPGAPVLSEAAALACASTELAVDAWEADDLGAFVTLLADAAGLAETAPEPGIAAAAGAVRAAAAATDPAPGITAFLEACVGAGYGL
jgi:hypothetical protein